MEIFMLAFFLLIGLPIPLFVSLFLFYLHCNKIDKWDNDLLKKVFTMGVFYNLFLFIFIAFLNLDSLFENEPFFYYYPFVFIIINLMLMTIGVFKS